MSEHTNLPGRVPTDEEMALQYAEVSRLREQNERRERLSPSLFDDDDPPVTAHASPEVAAVAPTSQTAESSNVGAGLRPAPVSETPKSPKRSEDVVEKKEAGSQEPEVKTEPAALGRV